MYLFDNYFFEKKFINFIPLLAKKGLTLDRMNSYQSSIEEYYQRVLKQFRDKNRKLNTHDCPLCRYPCGYLWANGIMYYDACCKCVNFSGMRPIRDEDLKEFISMNLDVFDDILNKEN